jgi:hypothetical protein
MIVHYCSDRRPILQEIEDFRRFKIVLGCLPEQHPQVPELTSADDDNALTHINIVPTLPGAPTDQAWRADYERMISTAANSVGSKKHQTSSGLL